MEIGSMDSMVGMMGMQGGMMGAQGGQRKPPDAAEMSSKFVDALDSDGDGQLSQSEFSVDGSSDGNESSEVFDILDTDEDGFVSQEELEADMQSKMGSGKPPHPPGGINGIQSNGDTEGFQQLLNMVGSGSGSEQSQGTEQYARMQEAMLNGGFGEQSYSAGLNISA